MLPLLLNTAMDNILKARYDKYRKNGTFPPEAKELEDERMRPFEDIKTLNDWRENLSTLRVVDKNAGYVLQGKIDDVLVEEDGALVPTDFKSSGNAPSEEKQKYYRDQLAAYGLMFSKHGHDVSNRAYLLHYFVRDKNDPSLEVKFDSFVDKVKIDLGAIEEKLGIMVKLLNGPYPGHNPNCEKCSYYDERGKKVNNSG
ncbi:MAG: PD-(D/E)XK nuclease family protein [Candidatus Woykebacteria bacterium]